MGGTSTFQIPILLPVTDVDIDLRLALIDRVFPKAHKLLKFAIEQGQQTTGSKKATVEKNLKKLLKSCKITDLDRLLLIVYHDWTHPEIRQIAFENLSLRMTSDMPEIIDQIREIEFPIIRAKLAVQELLFSFSSDYPWYWLIETSDLYLRSDAMLDFLGHARVCRYLQIEGKDALKELLGKMGTQIRRKNRDKTDYSRVKTLKILLEVGVEMVKSREISVRQFEDSVRIMKIKVSDGIRRRMLDKKIRKSELALEILTESEWLPNSDHYWEMTKNRGSSKLSHPIEARLGHLISDSLLTSPILRTAKVWRPLENLEVPKNCWEISLRNRPINRNGFKVFFMEHDEV